MRRWLLLPLPGLLCLLLPPLVAAQDKPATKHLEALLALLNDIRPENTSYRHKDGEVIWKGQGGAPAAVCHTDCSGLVNAILKQCYGIGEDRLRTWLGTARPLAKQYHQAILAEKGFQRIKKISDVAPGDLIAIRYEPGAGNTGHTMFIVEKPQPVTASKPEIPDTTQYQVTIIDCSSTGHGPQDTRRQADARYASGLGRGVCRLYCDPQGEIVGYTWSMAGGSKYYDKERHLVVGRFKLPLP
jgi:hypothetical protein